MSVALDVVPEHTYQWIDAAAPTHPSLIDTRHVTGELFGFINIPMAVWIDECGTIVRNAESASIERSPLRDMDIPDGLPERLTQMFTEVKQIPDDAEAYRAAIVDWVDNGGRSRFALTPDEVIERSRPRGADEAEAAACFELGQHLRADRRRRRRRAVVAAGPRARPGQLDVQAPGLDARHHAPRTRPRTTSSRARTTSTPATGWTTSWPAAAAPSTRPAPSSDPGQRRASTGTDSARGRSLGGRWSTCAGWPSRPCARRR